MKLKAMDVVKSYLLLCHQLRWHLCTTAQFALQWSAATPYRWRCVTASGAIKVPHSTQFDALP